MNDTSRKDVSPDAENGEMQLEVHERPIFFDEIRAVINRHSKENGSNTPDFILAQFLTSSLEALDFAINQRSDWYGRRDVPGQGARANEPTTATTRNVGAAEAVVTGAYKDAPATPAPESKACEGCEKGWVFADGLHWRPATYYKQTICTALPADAKQPASFIDPQGQHHEGCRCVEHAPCPPAFADKGEGADWVLCQECGNVWGDCEHQSAAADTIADLRAEVEQYKRGVESWKREEESWHDEMTALRVEKLAAQQRAGDLCAEAQELRAECERLKAAVNDTSKSVATRLCHELRLPLDGEAWERIQTGVYAYGLRLESERDSARSTVDKLAKALRRVVRNEPKTDAAAGEVEHVCRWMVDAARAALRDAGLELAERSGT